MYRTINPLLSRNCINKHIIMKECRPKVRTTSLLTRRSLHGKCKALRAKVLKKHCKIMEPLKFIQICSKTETNNSNIFNSLGFIYKNYQFTIDLFFNIKFIDHHHHHQILTLAQQILSFDQ